MGNNGDDKMLEPWIREPERWVTTEHFASVFNRSTQTIRRWCLDGTMQDANIQTYQDVRGRWWIRLDEQ